MSRTNRLTRGIRHTISAVIIALLVWWMLRGTDFSEIGAILKRADLGKLVLIPIGYMVLCFFRSLRLRKAPEFKNVDFLKLTGIVAVHSFWNNILPARSGELSFLYLSKKYFKMEIGHSAGILVTVRLYDFLMTSLLFILSFFFLGYAMNRSPLLIMTAVLFLIFMIFLLWKFTVIIRFLMALSQKIRWTESTGNAIARMLGYFLQGTAQMGNSGMRGQLLFTTFLCSAACLFIFQMVMTSLHIDCSILATLTGSSVALFSSMLPLNAPGNTGVLDAGWVLGFLFVGIDKNSAVLSAIVMHSTLIASATLAGLSGYIILLLRK